MPSGYKGSSSPARKAPGQNSQHYVRARRSLMAVITTWTTRTPVVEDDPITVEVWAPAQVGAGDPISCTHWALRRGDVCPACRFVHPGNGM